MQIGEKHLALSQQRIFRRLRFLDLHDHVGASENFFGACANFGAYAAKHVIAKTNTGTGVGLYDHLVPMHHKFMDARWRQPHTMLVFFYFFRDTDKHVRLPPECAPCAGHARCCYCRYFCRGSFWLRQLSTNHHGKHSLRDRLTAAHSSAHAPAKAHRHVPPPNPAPTGPGRTTPCRVPDAARPARSPATRRGLPCRGSANPAALRR